MVTDQTMNIESRPWDREEQTELPEPIKVRFTGKLRTRINERQSDYVGKYDRDTGEYDEDPDTEVYEVSQFRPFMRQKTNVVIETEEEAYAVLGLMSYYSAPGITWMNGPMRESAKRVCREIRTTLDEMGVDVEHSQRAAIL